LCVLFSFFDDGFFSNKPFDEAPPLKLFEIQFFKYTKFETLKNQKLPPYLSPPTYSVNAPSISVSPPTRAFLGLTDLHIKAAVR
jgi:hypothetical protein